MATAAKKPAKKPMKAPAKAPAKGAKDAADAKGNQPAWLKKKKAK